MEAGCALTLAARVWAGVDCTKPDEIENSKLVLRNLLGEVQYTQQISGEIASRVAPAYAERTSPSFAAFRAAVRNGYPDTAAAVE